MNSQKGSGSKCLHVVLEQQSGWTGCFCVFRLTQTHPQPPAGLDHSLCPSIHKCKHQTTSVTSFLHSRSPVDGCFFLRLTFAWKTFRTKIETFCVCMVGGGGLKHSCLSATSPHCQLHARIFQLISCMQVISSSWNFLLWWWCPRALKPFCQPLTSSLYDSARSLPPQLLLLTLSFEKDFHSTSLM